MVKPQLNKGNFENVMSDPRYDDLWSRPGYLIRRLHQIHVGLFAEECGQKGLTPVQFAILSVLAQNDGLDQLSLSRAVGIDRTSGADVIKRLVRNELVTRTPSETDRRAKLVKITEQGRKVVQDMRPAMEAAQDRMMAPLSPESRADFIKALRIIIESNNDASRAPVG